MDIKKIIQAKQPVVKRKCLNIGRANSWKNFVVDLLSNNPTVSISAHARIVSEVGNLVAGVTHSKGSLFDFSIGCTVLTDHLVQRGIESQGKLQADFGISGIVDYWSTRYTHLTPYGALIVYGLDNTFEWIRFPYGWRVWGMRKWTLDTHSNSYQIQWVDSILNSRIHSSFAMTTKQK